MCCGVSRAPKMKAGRHPIFSPCGCELGVGLGDHVPEVVDQQDRVIQDLDDVLVPHGVGEHRSQDVDPVFFCPTTRRKKERKKKKKKERQVSVDDEEREDDFASVARAHLLLISFLRFFSDRAAAVEVGLSAFATPPPRTLLTGSFPPAKDLAAGVCATTGFDASTTMPS